MNPISASSAAAYVTPPAATPKPAAQPDQGPVKKDSVSISPEAQALLAGDKDRDGDSA